MTLIKSLKNLIMVVYHWRLRSTAQHLIMNYIICITLQASALVIFK